MNGMILQSSPENKDIKFINKKGVDTESKEESDLFEKIVSSLIENEQESKNGSFLLKKLLNISSELDTKGKTFSDFSKDEILEDLKVTKGNKDDNSVEDELPLEDLFKVALALKSGETINITEIKSEPLKTALNKQTVIDELKSAKNIKELLSIADKNGIKVKNFEFFKEDRALNLDDKKLVKKVTSQDIFKMIEPKDSFKTDHKASTQSVLAKLINKEPTTIEAQKEVVKTPQLASMIQKSKKATHTKSSTKTDTKTTPQIKTTQQPKMTDESLPKEIKVESKVESNIEEEQNLDLDLVKETHTKKTQTNPIKTSQNTLSDLLKNSSTTTESKKSEDSILIKEDTQELKDNQTEKSSNHTEIKTETTIKTKESHEVKRSLNTFAAEFKEKVESYKSPIMKVKMQLSPQNLGDVDVTLVNRGSTLQVNITSNTNSMALFMQNQAEFKNSLVNMGFSDLQMSFSDNGSSQNHHEKKKDDEKNSSSYENINSEEENDSIDIILPNYV
jgi:hypothetical protein